MQPKAGPSAEELADAAWAARAAAHAPYSGFRVGAALETTTGGIVTGCNVENAAHNLGLCAERVALFSALAQGLHPGRRLVIATETPTPTPPCGGCRQVLRELAPETEIISLGAGGTQRRWLPRSLLPQAEPPVRPDAFDPRPLIALKRDGGALAPAEIDRLIAGLTRGEVDAHQMSAFLMAVYQRGMQTHEVIALTEAMLASGERLTHPDVPGPKVDKHSTGGVGDKLSLPLLPLALAAGLHVPMISGRGLGHTGGTLDKLEAIPGYRVELTSAELQARTRDPGGFIAGQTRDLVPADRLMYALRDVTATVPSVPLIVSSILSKKLAAGLDGLVLDVKFGRGAFMSTEAEAVALARLLVRVAEARGLRAVALLTRMDDPIGTTVGNALEVRESFRLLQGGVGAPDLRELTLALGGLMIALAGRAPTMRAGARQIEQLLASGAAVERAVDWVLAQGGDAACVRQPDSLAVASRTRLLRAPRAGYVQAIDARLAGSLCVQLGGGRQHLNDRIDLGVGLEFLCRRGVQVGRGDPLVRFYLPDGAGADDPLPGEDQLVTLAAEPVAPLARVASLVHADGVAPEPWDVELPPPPAGTQRAPA